MQRQPCVNPWGLMRNVLTSDLKLRVLLADHDLMQGTIGADEVA